MTSVAEISGAVRRLPKRDLDRFRKWFAEYDAADGRLGKFAREAHRAVRNGRATAL